METIQDIVLGIGLDAVKNKLKSKMERKQIEERLKKYLSRKLKQNWFCSREEEFDFEGLANYIRSDLIEDMEIRLFGDKEERNSARLQILKKAVYFSQANTKLSKDRAERMVTDIMDILKDFYRKRAPREFRLIAGEVVDDICSYQDKKSQEIVEKIEDSSLLSIDKNLALIKNGGINEAKQNITTALQAIGITHPLYPYYRIGFRTIDGKDEMFSCPLTSNMPEEYRPKIQLSVTATLGGKKVYEFNSYNLNYAFRHQIPFVLNVVDAQKLLGNTVDPFQDDAIREIGKQRMVYPPKFPPAFPCALLGDGKNIIDYLLLRTKEILDDGTCVVTNDEQKNAPFKIEFQLNLQNNIFTFHIEPLNQNNAERLLIFQTIKAITDSATIKLYSFEHRVDLVTANLSPNSYQPMFDTIQEDIQFLEKIIDIENYTQCEIVIPDIITQEELQQIDYMVELIRGGTCEGKWSEFTINIPVQAKMKEAFEQSDQFVLIATGKVSINLWNQSYEIPVKRSFPYVTVKNKERVVEKLQVLDLGDPIKITFVPGEAGDVVQDQMDVTQ